MQSAKELSLMGFFYQLVHAIRRYGGKHDFDDHLPEIHRHAECSLMARPSIRVQEVPGSNPWWSNFFVLSI